MTYAVAPTQADYQYFLSQNPMETERIVSGMTSLMETNEDNLAAMQNQKWFERMWFTISGKNKATVQEMVHNRDRLAAYSVQIFRKLIDEKRVSDAIITNLTVRLNEIYASHLQLQEVMCEIISKLNGKIDSVDHYHNLITDIQNGKYNCEEILMSLLLVLSRLDKRTISDAGHLTRIKETLERNQFDFSRSVRIDEFTEQLLNLPDESVGQIYLFAQNYKKYKFVQFACCFMEQYHFEPKSNRPIIQSSAVEHALAACSLCGTEVCDINMFYDDLSASAVEKLGALDEVSFPPSEPAPTDIGENTQTEQAANAQSQAHSKKAAGKKDFSGSAPHKKTRLEINIEKEFERQRKAIQKPNLMVVGGTGAGKSSLINRVFGKNVAAVGAGVPVTKGIDRYESQECPVIFWDTEGYEIAGDETLDSTNFDTIIKPKIQAMNSGKLKDCIHLVWYCISISGHRVTDYDIRNIQWFKDHNMKIAVVFTQCDNDQELPSGRGQEATGFQDTIEKRIPGLAYFETCADRKDIPLDLEALLEWSIEALPNAQMRESFIAAQKVSVKNKKKLAYGIVTTATVTAAASGGLNPFPLADAILIVPQQLAMAVSLGALFWFDSISETAGHLIKTQIAAIAGRTLAASFLKIVPIVGQIVNAGIAGAITYGLGMALTEAYSKAYENFLDTGELPDWAAIFSSDLFMNNLVSFFNEYKDKKGVV